MCFSLRFMPRRWQVFLAAPWRNSGVLTLLDTTGAACTADWQARRIRDIWLVSPGGPASSWPTASICRDTEASKRATAHVYTASTIAEDLTKRLMCIMKPLSCVAGAARTFYDGRFTLDGFLPMRRALLLVLSAFLLLPAHAAPPSCLGAVRAVNANPARHPVGAQSQRRAAG